MPHEPVFWRENHEFLRKIKCRETGAWTGRTTSPLKAENAEGQLADIGNRLERLERRCETVQMN